MADIDRQLQARQALWEKRFKAHAEHGEWCAFALATVQGAIEEINALKEAGRRLVATRDGQYRNWDPDVLKVDEAAEGYIFDCLKRFNAMKNDSFTARIISEEAGDRAFGAGAAKVFVISDPFDGSLLYKNDLGAFYYTTVAVWDESGNPLATAVGDCVNRRVDFAGAKGAFSATFEGAKLLNLKPSSLSRNADLAKATIESYMMKPKFLYQEKSDAYSFVETFKPLLSQVKFICPNGGPCGFADVAFGRMDVYFAHKQPMIEIFSGVGVAKAAGAIVTDFDGKPVAFTSDINARLNVVCSANREIHDKVLAVVAEIKKAKGLTWKRA